MLLWPHLLHHICLSLSQPLYPDLLTALMAVSLMSTCLVWLDQTAARLRPLQLLLLKCVRLLSHTHSTEYNTAPFQVLATSGCNSVNIVSQSENRIQVQFDSITIRKLVPGTSIAMAVEGLVALYPDLSPQCSLLAVLRWGKAWHIPRKAAINLNNRPCSN